MHTRNKKEHHISLLACIKLHKNGIFELKQEDTCQTSDDFPACKYRGCYTTKGKQCVFPFNYRNISDDGVITPLTLTKCSTIDLYRPWCPTGNVIAVCQER